MDPISLQKNGRSFSTAIFFSILFLFGLTYSHTALLGNTGIPTEKKSEEDKSADTQNIETKKSLKTDGDMSLVDTKAKEDTDAAIEDETLDETPSEEHISPVQKDEANQKQQSAKPEEEESKVDQNLLPNVAITPFGEEYNIKVKYNHPMDFKGGNYIEYIRMETLEGESLGIKAFNESSTEASVEFMVNPKLAKFDTFRLIANSTKAGLIKSTHKLQPTPKDEKFSGNEGSTASKSGKSPKKKLFGFFEI